MEHRHENMQIQHLIVAESWFSLADLGADSSSMPPWLQYTLPAAVLSRKCLLELDPDTSRVLTPLSTAYIITYLAFIQAHGHCE